jgi:hypothetical protein
VVIRRPAPISAIPTIKIGLTPTRVTNAWETVDAAMTLSATTRLLMPVLSGE